MITALYLLAVQGLLGAFDTLYYHEWRARLPGRVPGTAAELTLHGARDLVYAVLFATLPFVRYDGAWSWIIVVLLLAEIVITLADFAIEDRVRRPFGGVLPGERVTHALMGIVYGAALAHLVPEVLTSASRPTGLTAWDAPDPLRVVLPALSLGVLLSGMRDIGAAFGPRWLGLPWVDGPVRRGHGGVSTRHRG